MDPCTLPLRCRLLADHGEGPAVEVVLAAVDAEHAANVDAVLCRLLPPHTATGVEISDARGWRLWSLQLAEPVDVPAGAAVLVPAGALRVPLAEAAALGLDLPAPVGAALGGGASARSQANTRS